MRLEAIVFAAGESSRMGTNKLLLEIDGRKVIEHIISSLKPIDTIVVLGHKPDDIKDIVESLGAKTVLNQNYKKGMITSFQTGLKAVKPDTNAVFLVLSDTFGFKHSLLDELREVLEKDPEALLVSPVYEGKRGHPVLVHRKLFKEFLNVQLRETMKTVVNRYGAQHRYVESDIWCTIDLDTPEDYEKAKKMWVSRV